MSTVWGDPENEQHTVLFVGETPMTAGEISGSFGAESTAVTVVEDGQQAIRWLSSVSESSGDQQPPDTVVLTGGVESPAWPTLLHAIKSSPRLGAIPVVVLTDDETDAETASDLGGNAHVTVPESPAAYTDCLETLSEFWTQWTRVPSENLLPDHE